MECAQRSDILARRELESEIRNSLYNNSAEYKNLEVVLPSTPDMTSSNMEVRTCRKKTKNGIENDIRKLLYDESAEYKDVILHSPNSNIRDRSHSCRRQGLVDLPVVKKHKLTGNCDNGDNAGYMDTPEEERRSRNLSESSYFSQMKHQETIDDHESCHEHQVQRDRVCQSRLRGIHGRFSVDNINNPSAIKCLRWRMRRNALCDPLRMLLPQYTRERLERDNAKKKSSLTRKLSQFVTVNFALNRDEDLI